MGLDAMALCTSAAIATTEKFTEHERAAVFVQDQVTARHLLAVLCVSLNPCGLTAVYLLYSIGHLWRWMMQDGSRSSMPTAVSGWTHKVVGYFSAVHLFFLYLVGAELDGISLTLPCPIARTLGLTQLDNWSWSTWASSASVLCFFLSSFSKVRALALASL